MCIYTAAARLTHPPTPFRTTGRSRAGRREPALAAQTNADEGRPVRECDWRGTRHIFFFFVRGVLWRFLCFFSCVL